MPSNISANVRRNINTNTTATTKPIKSGIINEGYEYESLVPAFFALELFQDSNIKSFTFEINASSYGKFDDLVVEIVHNSNVTEKFAIQLKHREEGKHVLYAAKEFNNSDSKGKPKGFNVKGYFDAIKDEDLEVQRNYKFILFTNAQFLETEKLQQYNVFSSSSPFNTNLFNANRISQFEIKNQRSTTNFYQNFYLMSEQKNVSEMRQSIKSIFKEKFFSNDEKATCYMAFFDKVRKGYYTNNKITKEEVILNLVKLIMSGFAAIPPISREPNRTIETVEEAIKLFDLIILPNISKKMIQDKWQNILLHDVGNIESKARDLKFIEKNENFSEEMLAQLVAYLEEKPLFLHVKKNSEKTINTLTYLLQDLKGHRVHLVLFGRNIKDDRFKGFKIFQNLQSLLIDENVYQEITRTLYVCIQGRNAKSIKTLNQKYDLNLDEFITPSEIFQCLGGDLKIGKKLDELPEFYISRTLLKAEPTIYHLNKTCETKTTIVHCSGKSAKFEKFLQEEDFQFDIQRTADFKQNEDTKIASLILTDEELKEDHKCPFEHLRLFNDDTFKWVGTEVKSNNLSSIYENNLNVVCGNSGIGKTTVMKYLAYQCPLPYWVVTVPMQQMDLLFETEHATRAILDQFLNLSQQYELDKYVCSHLLEKKQLVFMFDGLNELHANSVDKAVDVIQQVMKEGYKVWIFCTPTYNQLLERHFKTLCFYEIEELAVADQERYVSERLQQAKVQTKLITQVKEMLFETDIDKFKEILKVPLILYVLTDILNNQKDIMSLKKDFTIYKIFSRFIEERLKHHLKKKQCTHFKALSEIIEGFKNYYFDNYQVAALQTCLEKDLTDLLNINNDRRFISCLQKNDDFLGFLKISNNNAFMFVHQSFAKYFVARWLSQNFDLAPKKIKTMILASEYDGIRRFFDAKLAEKCPLHLAVLDQDIARVKKYARTCINDTDGCGRTALHLATSIGKTYPVLDQNRTLHSVVSRNAGKDEEILEYLLSIVAPEDVMRQDKLLEWNSFEYADAASCIISLEKLSTKAEISLDYLKTNFHHLYTLSYYCVTLGCINLLKTAIAKFGLSKLEEEHKETSLLFLALKHNHNEVASLLLENGTKLPKLNFQKQLLFYEAVSCGHTEIVRLLLNQNINYEAKDEVGTTPLTVASRKGHKDIVKLLVEKGACVNGSEKPPLLKAAYMGRTEVVEYLIDHGANMNPVNNWKKNALHLAAEMGHLSTVKCLLEKGADKGSMDRFKRTALHLAAYEGHEDVVHYLIAQNFNIFAKDEDNRTAREIANLRGHTIIERIFFNTSETLSKRPQLPKNYETRLHRASLIGDLETVKLELSQGSDINEACTGGDTALHIAACEGHLHIVKYLLAQKSDPGSSNVDGRVPLHLACHRGNLEVVKELLNRGQNNASDHWGLKPIHRAAYEGHIDIVKILIEFGVDVNSVADDYLTPIHSAAIGGHVDLLDYLLSKNGDVRKTTDKNETCLHFAAANGWTKVVGYLIRRYEEIIDLTNCYQKTALHLAAEKGYIETVQVLIEGGADVTLMDSERKTAFDVAVHTNRKNVVRLLKTHQNK